MIHRLIFASFDFDDLGDWHLWERYLCCIDFINLSGLLVHLTGFERSKLSIGIATSLGSFGLSESFVS